MSHPLPLLTIAGSDSGGAAGLQADLKTWAALGAYGMNVITAVTAQNSERVAAVHYLPPEMVAVQIDAVLSDYGAAAIKTGFLGRVEIIEAVAGRLALLGGLAIRPLDRGGGGGGLPTRPTIIIDPVLVNHRGEAMFGPEVAAAYRKLLFPLADLVTPNRGEAALLGVGVAEQGEGEQGSGGAGEQGGGEETLDNGPRLLVKGWRRDEGQIVDLFWDGDRWHQLPQPLIDTANTHGSGDTLSAAICAYRAQGHDWPEAIRRAQAYTHAAIRRGAAWRLSLIHIC